MTASAGAVLLSLSLMTDQGLAAFSNASGRAAPAVTFVIQIKGLTVTGIVANSSWIMISRFFHPPSEPSRFAHCRDPALVAAWVSETVTVFDPVSDSSWIGRNGATGSSRSLVIFLGTGLADGVIQDVPDAHVTDTQQLRHLANGHRLAQGDDQRLYQDSKAKVFICLAS